VILEAESIEIEAWFTVRSDADEAFREWAVEEGYGGQKRIHAGKGMHEKRTHLNG